ncbi:hypothetical protein LCGC14_2585820, partial [marine sediment metagenome]
MYVVRLANLAIRYSLSTMQTGKTTINPSELPTALIAQGRHWANTQQLARMTGQHGAVLHTSLSRLIRQRRMFTPARGLYVVVPPEYRGWGVAPADWFIDAMMSHLKRSYYVGFLNAAAMYGAAHQAPQTFRAVVSSPLKDRDINRVRLRFTASDRVSEMAVEQHTVHTGYVAVATRETTAVDLAWRPELGGGLSNVATVLKELGELDGTQLARMAEH